MRIAFELREPTTSQSVAFCPFVLICFVVCFTAVAVQLHASVPITGLLRVFCVGNSVSRLLALWLSVLGVVTTFV